MEIYQIITLAFSVGTFVGLAIGLAMPSGGPTVYILPPGRRRKKKKAAGQVEELAAAFQVKDKR